MPWKLSKAVGVTKCWAGIDALATRPSQAAALMGAAIVSQALGVERDSVSDAVRGILIAG
jgi:hypothetical protein